MGHFLRIIVLFQDMPDQIPGQFIAVSGVGGLGKMQVIRCGEGAVLSGYNMACVIPIDQKSLLFVFLSHTVNGLLVIP